MKISKTTFLKWAAAGSSLLLAGQVLAAGQPRLVEASMAAGRPYVSTEVLVQFFPGASAQQKQAALKAVGASSLQTVRSGTQRGDLQGELQLAHVPAAVGVANAL